LAVVEDLEQAWKAQDVSAALALFATDAVAASSSSQRWQGQAELRESLVQMWNPTAAPDTQTPETLARCALDERVTWQFSYAETGGTGTADVVVQGSRITHLFWAFTPHAAVLSEQKDSTPAPENATPTFGLPVLVAGASALLILALRGQLPRTVRWPQRGRQRGHDGDAEGDEKRLV
jgi:hypothetical protein